jgi:hypothetical protein
VPLLVLHSWLFCVQSTQLLPLEPHETAAVPVTQVPVDEQHWPLVQVVAQPGLWTAQAPATHFSTSVAHGPQGSVWVAPFEHTPQDWLAHELLPQF